MTAPKEWPPGAREAVARALAPALYGGEEYRLTNADRRRADCALAALAPFVEAREKAAYQAGWNDREADLLAGIDRVYGTENKP